MRPAVQGVTCVNTLGCNSVHYLEQTLGAWNRRAANACTHDSGRDVWQHPLHESPDLGDGGYVSTSAMSRVKMASGPAVVQQGVSAVQCHAVYGAQPCDEVQTMLLSAWKHVPMDSTQKGVIQ